MQGVEERDQETGLVTREARCGPFVLIEHQRQDLPSGSVKTNGIDIWEICEGKGVKRLSVNYIPFTIKYVDKAGKAPWIEAPERGASIAGPSLFGFHARSIKAPNGYFSLDGSISPLFHR